MAARASSIVTRCDNLVSGAGKDRLDQPEHHLFIIDRQDSLPHTRSFEINHIINYSAAWLAAIIEQMV